MAVLNNAQIAITNLVAGGKTQKQIAKMFSTSEATISKIVTGKRTHGLAFEMISSFKNVRQVVMSNAEEMYRQDERMAWIVAGIIVFAILFGTLIYSLTLYF